MIDALAFIAGAASTIAIWLAVERRSVNASDAARVLSERAQAARKAERSRYVRAHIAELQADIARRVAKPKPEFLADAEGRN
jgi:hypothetical protein